MSRTRNHNNRQAVGKDFGARYKVNKGYCAGTGEDAKKPARLERRTVSRKLIRDAIYSMNVSKNQDTAGSL